MKFTEISRIARLLVAWSIGYLGLLPSMSWAQSAPGDGAATNSALVPVPQEGRAWFFELHESYLARAKAGPIGLLFLGDSITQGWSKVPGVWERYFGEYQPANFGIGGDRTQQLLWRIEQGTLDGIDPRVVVLLIGTNNSGSHSAAQILAAQERILERIRAKLPKAKILLLEIFPRGPRPSATGEISDKARMDAAKRMKVIDEVNAGLRKFDDGRTVRVLNINSVWFDESGRIPERLMPDQLHLSEEGYVRWAEAMRERLEEMWNAPR